MEEKDVSSGGFEKGAFGYDQEFLATHLPNLVKLSTENGKEQLLISPEFQGRVMTSTAAGPKGKSFGWINYDLISSGELVTQHNPFGGEDRFWLGPEGGQYALFFEPGVAFDFEHWQTPPELDTEPFEVLNQSGQVVQLQKEMHLTNYSGFEFHLSVSREITLLNRGQIEVALDMSLDLEIEAVAFESKNLVTNIGEEPWEFETGLISIWILGMFKPSANTTIVVPYREGPEDILGQVVNDTYFGSISDSRLQFKDGFVFFRGDGKSRGKIGLSPQRAVPFVGSYDPVEGVLTLVQFSLAPERVDYVNSLWEMQEEPYRGDAVNSYNDGPLDGGRQLGPFYELESSSPAISLAPNDSELHVHRTYHFVGQEMALNKIAMATLGIRLDEVKNTLPLEN